MTGAKISLHPSLPKSSEICGIQQRKDGRGIMTDELLKTSLTNLISVEMEPKVA